MISRNAFSIQTNEDYSGEQPMLRLIVEYHLSGRRVLPLDASSEEIASEFESMIDQGMRHIYGDVREHLQRIRAEIYQVAVMAFATGRVQTNGVDKAMQDLETLLQG